MLKQLTIPVLGLVVLASATVPAAADRGKPAPRNAYTYKAQPQNRATNQRRKFNPKLDFESEAVWRNLRPEWFVD
jgi:hypothetical protein